jgi:DNA polymerase elongation subunit (family B)
MLVDYEYKAGRLVASYIGADGNLKVKHFNYRNPVKFQLTDDHDPMAHSVYKSWDGRKVKQMPTNKPDRYSIYEYLDSLPKDEQDEIFNYQEPNIFFCDIETEIVDTGFVEPAEATSRILSIAVVHKRKVMILGIKALHRNELYWITDEINKRFRKLGVTQDYEVDYIDFSVYENSERDMLDYFFQKLVPRMPVLTGWNFVNYDWVFLVNRARRIGVDPTQASITSNLVKSFKTAEELPMHRVVVDYMDLYKKWDTSVKIKESNALDFVAEKTLGGEGKVHFTGGLQTLYEQDYKMYLFYNAVDTVLVQMIHEKMKYINVMYATAALSKTRILDSLSALRVTEGIMRNDLRSMKNIVLCRDYEQDDVEEKVEGGYVQDPAIRGLNKWLVCYDFASLYPTTQRQNNIAPESFKGVKIPGQMKADFNGRKVDILPTDIISVAYGEEGRPQQQAVFSNDFSVTCNKLSEIYNDRKKFKKKMLQTKDELKHLEKELAELL